MKNKVSDLNDYDCCKGVKSQTPASTANPPGMPALNYRVGTHARFKETMLSQLSRQKSLRSLHIRKDDDPTIALIDAWSTVLDVLTFYQERVASEGYLLTATERRSILELARQIGYELAPGIAAETYLAFLMEEAPGAPASAKIAAGTRAQNQPDQDELPQSFETAADITARPEWNRLRPQMLKPQEIFGKKELYLDGIDLTLSTGDVLLFINENAKEDDPNSKKWDIRRLTEVDINPATRQTRVAWKMPVGTTNSELTANDPIRVFVFRQRASIFGHNAPDWKTYPDEAKATYLGLDNPKELTENEKKEWPGFEMFAPKYPQEVYRVWPGTYLVQPTTESVFNVAAEVADAAVKSALLDGISVIPESIFKVIKHLLLTIAAAVDVGNNVLTSSGSVVASELNSLSAKGTNLLNSLSAFLNPADGVDLSAEFNDLITKLTEFFNSAVPIIPLIQALTDETNGINFDDINDQFDEARNEIASIPIEITEAIGKAVVGLAVSMSVKAVMNTPLPFEKTPEMIAFVAAFVAKGITAIIDFNPLAFGETDAHEYNKLDEGTYGKFFSGGCSPDDLYDKLANLPPGSEETDTPYDVLNDHLGNCSIEDLIKYFLFLILNKDEELQSLANKAINAMGSDNLVGLTTGGAFVAVGAGAVVGAGTGATVALLSMSYYTVAGVLVPIVIQSLGALIIATIIFFIYRQSISRGANRVARDICNAVIAACNPELKNHPDRRPRLKLSENMIDLDNLYPKIASESWMLLSLPDTDEVYRIDNVNESARSEFTLNSKSTRVTLRTGEKAEDHAVYKISDEALFTLREYVDNDFTDDDPPAQVLNEFIKMLEAQKRKIFTQGKSEFKDKIQELAAETEAIFSAEEEAGINTDLTETIKKVVENGQCNNLEDKFSNKENTDTVRMTAVFAESKALPIALEPWAEDRIGVGENSILLSHLIPGLAPGRPLIISGRLVDSTEKVSQLIRVTNSCFVERTTNEYQELTSAVAVDLLKQHPEKIFTKIFFAPALKLSLQRESVEIFANATRAVHGETRNVILGSGDASIINQQFELKEIPLTYVSSINGAGSTLQVRVNDVLWQEVRTLYDVPGNEKVYAISMNNHGQVTIQFGDGINGARLPTGIDSVTARYRVGSGSAGMVAAEKINMLISRPLGVNGVINPLPSAGAADPEKIEEARKNAPLTVLTIDRIVSLQDYEDYARAFPGIGKAQAKLLWDGQKEIVHLTIAPAVVGDACDETSPQFINLQDAIRTQSDSMQSFEVQCFEKVEFDVAARIKFDSSYEEDRVFRGAGSALKASFSFDAREFGQPVTTADIIVVLQSATGVTAVDLDKLAYTSDPNTPLRRLSATSARREEAGSNKPAQLLVLNPDGINLQMVKQLI